jgi:hypothetical protein
MHEKLLYYMPITSLRALVKNQGFVSFLIDTVPILVFVCRSKKYFYCYGRFLVCFKVNFVNNQAV